MGYISLLLVLTWESLLFTSPRKRLVPFSPTSQLLHFLMLLYARSWWLPPLQFPGEFVVVCPVSHPQYVPFVTSALLGSSRYLCGSVCVRW